MENVLVNFTIFFFFFFFGFIDLDELQFLEKNCFNMKLDPNFCMFYVFI